MIWVYDVETLINMFCVTFYNKAGGYRVFKIVKGSSDLLPLKAFLEIEVKGLVGFNSMSFDRPVLEKLMTLTHLTSEEQIKEIYNFAQLIIIGEKPHWTKSLHHIEERDIYLIHHFNNDARRTSLKWIQCHLGMRNIQDMPIKHDEGIKSLDDIETVVKYNINDVDTTYDLYVHPKTQELMKVRKEMAERFKAPAINNMSNSSMGEFLFRRALYGIEEPPTPVVPEEVRVADLIVDKVRFTNNSFQNVLDAFRKLVLNPSGPMNYDYEVKYDGMSYQFGLGGLHAARENTYYDEEIESIDVKSYYPNISINFQLKPAHLSSDFIRVYKSIYDHRASLPKGAENAAWKEALNSAFGKSNSIYSFLYDPNFTFAITINGQLLLAMLCEAITESGCGRIVMANTDGIEVRVNNKMELNKILNWWMKETGFALEGNTYDKLVIRDVNNYIAIDKMGKFKTKGAYELDKEFHKDPSARIIALTIREWLSKGIDTAEMYKFMKTRPLSDFFLFARAKTGEFIGLNKSGKDFPVPKTVRYVASKAGFIFARKTDKKYDKIHADTAVMFVNNLDGYDVSESDIIDNLNYGWYVKQVTKLTISRKPKLTLF